MVEQKTEDKPMESEKPKPEQMKENETISVEDSVRKAEEAGEKALQDKDLTIEEKKARQEQKALEEHLASWVPKTKIGRKVKSGQLKDIDYILEHEKKILESEIVDTLINIESELLAVGQAKGKFGGGKRRVWRQTQKKTKEGNILSFSAMAAVGDKSGHIGVGYGKAKETLPARKKAVRKAKLNIIKIKRGCGNFDCSCEKAHSVPFVVEGKSGSVRIKLLPAPQGTGLVVGDEVKKILRLAGIKDVYSVTKGQVKTTFNLAKATLKALEKTTKMELKNDNRD